MVTASVASRYSYSLLPHLESRPPAAPVTGDNSAQLNSRVNQYRNGHSCSHKCNETSAQKANNRTGSRAKKAGTRVEK